jgi:iron complex outermembrane receptor protein
VEHQLTDEVQVQGRNFDDRLIWVVGSIYDHQGQPTAPQTANIAAILMGNPYPSGGLVTNFASTNVLSRALFGSGTFKITPELSLTGGYRYTWNSVEQTSATATAPNVFGPAASSYAPGTETVEKDSSPGSSYNVSLDYQADDTTLVYGGYRRGFKRGGFNPLGAASRLGPGAPASPFAKFQPETVDDLYVGLKKQFNIAGVRGRFNLEGYYDFYHNQQASYITFLGTKLGVITINAPRATFRGLDTDLALDVTSWLTVTGDYSYIDAFYTRFPDESCVLSNCGVPSSGLNLAVNPVPFFSRNKAAVTMRFHTELPGARGEIAFAPTISYQTSLVTAVFAELLPQASSRLIGSVNQIALGGAVVPSYTLVDVRGEWNHIWGSRIDAAFNVTNVTNKTYIIADSGTLNFGAQGDAYGPPRMVTLELRTNF